MIRRSCFIHLSLVLFFTVPTVYAGDMPNAQGFLKECIAAPTLSATIVSLVSSACVGAYAGYTNYNEPLLRTMRTKEDFWLPFRAVVAAVSGITAAATGVAFTGNVFQWLRGKKPFKVLVPSMVSTVVLVGATQTLGYKQAAC